MASQLLQGEAPAISVDRRMMKNGRFVMIFAFDPVDLTAPVSPQKQLSRTLARVHENR
jgi:hypothetical protein